MNTSKLTQSFLAGSCAVSLALVLACEDDTRETMGKADGDATDTGSGDGDGDGNTGDENAGDGDGDSGDGDGDGDGDGHVDSGDGDGDGDGDPGGDGDGDGDPGGDGDGDPSGDGDGEPGEGDAGPTPFCGDGNIDLDETCDDGNMLDNDECTSLCLPANCGDTFVHEGVEQCDDGNMDESDGCSPQCTIDNPLVLCANPNMVLPDNGLGTPSTITIPFPGTVSDVDVTIQATHSWTGDLTWTLTKDAVSRVIVNRPLNGGGGCSSDDFDVTLDDESVGGSVQAQCTLMTPAVSGIRGPAVPLNAYDDVSMTGDWTMQSNDYANGDGGTFQSWCLRIAWQ